ncbi:MAG: GTPase ObgE [Candidatus Omnitrophica bacterium CG11_big_fil_rev_8_21_14_0_20_64_10]|nr:MAG: GTPase ObgE [Candidatus Omnitrophica bacterium CG11_big_fil_rev_8_21_14_0_20_64_10]
MGSPGFVDQAEIRVEAGRGGNGCHSLHTDKGARHPVPDGGNGGRGGAVRVRGVPGLTTLLDFQTRRHFRAQPGGNGSSNKKHGVNGADCLIEVPLGTILRDAETGDLIRELVRPGDEVVVAEGGAGGLGNASLKRREGYQKVREAGELQARPAGRPGEHRILALELKLLADVGIVGMPNAGKSTLLSRISAAHPRTAPYPFTTKHPVLGMAVGPDDFRFLAVDVPGLIEGASQGRGLGLDFLRHIERTRLLVHLVDMAGQSGSDPVQDYRQLNRELAAYREAVAAKPQIVAANKMDEPASAENLKRFMKEAGVEPIPVSAKTGDGLEQLIRRIEEQLRAL